MVPLEEATPTKPATLEKPECSRRIRFALFIKVLFKLIDEKIVREQAKSILHSCIKQNKKGNSKHASRLMKKLFVGWLAPN